MKCVKTEHWNYNLFISHLLYTILNTKSSVYFGVARGSQDRFFLNSIVYILCVRKPGLQVDTYKPTFGNNSKLSLGIQRSKYSVNNEHLIII